jgi:hypothetical protein
VPVSSRIYAEIRRTLNIEKLSGLELMRGVLEGRIPRAPIEGGDCADEIR